jgi:hypothetical protein
LVAGKKYTLLDGVALVCMSVGLILFTLADSTVQPNFNQTGKLFWALTASTSQAVRTHVHCTMYIAGILAIIDI